MTAVDHSGHSDVPVLTGDRLILRPPQRSDMDDRMAIGRDRDIERMYGRPTDGSPLTLQDATGWLASLTDHPCAWVIEHAGRAAGQGVHARTTSRVIVLLG